MNNNLKQESVRKQFTNKNFENKKIKLYNAYFSFFKEYPINFVISFVMIVFYIGVTIIFPKILGKFLSKINSNKKGQLIKELFRIYSIYIILWIGILIHFNYLHNTILTNSRSFFLKKFIIPIWKSIEEGSVSSNNIDSKLYYNINSFVTTSTEIIQAFIFTTLPIFVSIIIFIVNLPNVIESKIIILVTLIMLIYLVNAQKDYIKKVAEEQSSATEKVISQWEECVNNNNSIFSFNTNEKEYNNIMSKITDQTKKCYNKYPIFHLTNI